MNHSNIYREIWMRPIRRNIKKASVAVIISAALVTLALVISYAMTANAMMRSNYSRSVHTCIADVKAINQMLPRAEYDVGQCTKTPYTIN